MLAGPLGAGKTTLVQGIGDWARRSRSDHVADLRDRQGSSQSCAAALTSCTPTRTGSAAGWKSTISTWTRTSTDCVTVVEWGEGLVEDLSHAHLLITIGWQDEPADSHDNEPRHVTVAGYGERWLASADQLRTVLTDPPP